MCMGAEVEEVSRETEGAVEADLQRDFIWIYDNLGNKQAKAHDAPSTGAWNLLQECREDSALRRDFFRQVLTKLLPSRSELGIISRYQDDGRAHLEFIERLSAMGNDEEEEAADREPVLPPGSEGPQGEHGVPGAAGSNGAGG